MRHFTCECGSTLFFPNSRCLACGRETGYDPGSGEMVEVAAGSSFRRCENGLLYGVCNWVVPRVSSDPLCRSCCMNRIIPDLGSERNLRLWAKTEEAKRRLVVSLLRMGITLPSPSEDAYSALRFNLLSTTANPEVTTGYLQGVITVNLEEADDTYRQINRQNLGEASRTLTGHFRHESAHYFWHRFLSALAWDDPLRVAFRERFGEEWLDYAAALQRHYEQGAPLGWEERYISAYATSHPWEDWAETWAHYLQIIDGLETAECLGIASRHLALPLETLPDEAGELPASLPQSRVDDGRFLALLQRWLCLSTVLNEVSLSLGESPLYPFVISTAVARKLRLADHFATVWGSRAPDK